MLGEDGEELEVLVYTLIHALHVPKIQWEILRLCISSSDLTLKEDQGARLRDDVTSELRK
jgi:hypothetical protein